MGPHGRKDRSEVMRDRIAEGQISRLDKPDARLERNLLLAIQTDIPGRNLILCIGKLV